MKYFLFLLVYCYLGILCAHAQSYPKNYDNLLDSLALSVQALNEPIDISVADVPISEFLRSIARTSYLNLSIASSIDERFSNSFKNVAVKDILKFLTREYGLELRVTGSIFTIYKETFVPDVVNSDRNISYQNDSLSFQFQNIPLYEVLRMISEKTGKNIATHPLIKDKPISAFANNQNFLEALNMLAFSNGLLFKASHDNTFRFLPNPEFEQDRQRNAYNSTQHTSLDVQAFSKDSISIVSVNSPIRELIKTVCNQLKINFFLLDELKEVVSLNVQGIDFDMLCRSLFKLEENAYKIENGIYVFGKAKTRDLTELRLIHFQNRTVDSISSLLPEELKRGLQLKEFRELNSLFVSGNQRNIQQFENLLKKIDVSVPLVFIEVIIVDVNKSIQLATGINAGLAEEAIQTGGKVFPEIDFNLSGSSLNKIINSFNSFGWLNLGKVNPNFYLSMQALENNGYLHLRSTPKLSTLNGHEASMSVGNTEYYVIERSDYLGFQNSNLSSIKQYESVEAKLEINIRPMVSGNKDITLQVKVTQSDFTERITETAPPGLVSRTFKSLIRVKDGDMVLLGGLEEKRKESTEGGFPLLSRIPILKWLFSQKSDKKADSKLNIFIRPTVIY